MSPELNAAFEQWLIGKPEAVRRIARRYPPGTSLVSHGRTWYVIGYGSKEEDPDWSTLEITPINPSQDYANAAATRKAICKCCMDKLDAIHDALERFRS